MVVTKARHPVFTMSSIFQDHSIIDSLKDAASSNQVPSSQGFAVDVLDWDRNLDGKERRSQTYVIVKFWLTKRLGDYHFISRNATVPELIQLPAPVLRIVLRSPFRINLLYPH